MKRRVYLLCGVPGSGKTWVMNQLHDKFGTIEHDDFIGKDLLEPVKHRDENCVPGAPLLLDCPFGERELRGRLERAGYDVRPIFIVEPTPVVKERYLNREGRQLPKASVTRAVTIVKRVQEWNAPYGTSAQVLELLKKEAA